MNKEQCHEAKFYYVEAARKRAKARANVKIELVDGYMIPTLIGEKSRWETKNGDVIMHPNAYAAKGFSNMNYIRSSLRVKVGKLWAGKKSEMVNIIS